MNTILIYQKAYTRDFVAANIIIAKCAADGVMVEVPSLGNSDEMHDTYENLVRVLTRANYPFKPRRIVSRYILIPWKSEESFIVIC